MLKMKMSLAAILLALSAGPSLADWQYTHWGMTLSELQDVAPSDAMMLPETDSALSTPFGAVRAQAKYEASGLSGFVSFAFKDDKLSAVAFSFVGKDADLLVMQLQDQYGGPIAQPDMAEAREKIWHWRDEKGGNNVRFVHYPGSLDPDLLLYTPLRIDSDTGL